MKVGSKIFTLAAVLVAGTTAVALYSLDRIAAVNREIVTVATYHAPLARVLNDVEIEARNQELAYYALLAKRPGRAGAPELPQETLGRVAASSRTVDAAKDRALVLARATGSSARSRRRTASSSRSCSRCSNRSRGSTTSSMRSCAR